MKKRGTRGGDKRKKSKQERKCGELQKGKGEADWTDEKTAMRMSEQEKWSEKENERG